MAQKHNAAAQPYLGVEAVSRSTQLSSVPLAVTLVDHAGHLLHLRKAGVRQQGRRESLLHAQLSLGRVHTSLVGRGNTRVLRTK